MTIERTTLLDDRYRLDELVGHGGMADVYRATDELLNRTVAVKVLREIDEPSSRERFVAEARTLAGLNHPGLVTLLDAGILADRPYLVMSYADGPTLADRIGSGPLAPEEVAAIGVQVAQGLAYAHGLGVVHRDVKPSNVLFCGEGRVLLADFGIARLVGSAQHHTRTGQAIGSPAFLAPEQVAGDELGLAVDIYALGLVLLEALTGTRAFPGSAVESAMARLNAAPPIPTSLDPGWRSLLARMTHREPANRPSAAEVAAELGAGTAVQTGPLGAVLAADHRAEGSGDVTGELTMESPLYSAGPQELEADYRVENVHRGRRSRWALLVVGLALAVLVGVVLISQFNGSGGGGERPGVRMPDGVPTKFEAPLKDLHETIEGEAR